MQINISMQVKAIKEKLMEYEKPKIEVIEFDAEDLIVTSETGTGTTTNPDETPIVPLG